MSEIRFATIGTSMITGMFLDGLEAVEGAHLEAVYSRDLAKARYYGEPRGARLFFDDLDALAACEDVDAVYIASPNGLHASQALQMIDAGKAVLIEKPIATNLTQAREILARAAERGVVVMEAMRLAHDPGYGVLEELKGRLGPIHRCSMRYDQYSSRFDVLKGGEHTNIFDAELATGALMDLGVYPVHAMVQLFGEPDDLACATWVVDEERTHGRVDVMGSALFSYPQMVGEVSWSKCTQDILGCTIEGERASLMWHDIGHPRRITVVPLKGEPEVIEVANRDISEHLNLHYEIEDFISAMAGGYDTERTNRDTLVSIGIMETIRYRQGITFPGDEAELA